MRTKEQARALYRGVKPSEVATALECSHEHVLNLIKAGELEAVDISVSGPPRYRINRDSLDAFLARRAA